MKMIGNGTTITLATDGVVAGVQSCEMPNFTGDDVEVTDLDSVDFREYLFGGIADTGEVTLEVFQESSNALALTQGLIQDVTIVNRDATGATRTLTGSGYIRDMSLGNAAVAEAVVGTVVIKFDGIGTVPGLTYQPAP